MTGSVVRHLVLKDWRLNRMQITLSMAGGAVALALVHIKQEVPVVLGAVWFFLALILLGCFLPSTSVVNERKRQNLAFLMSLPISPMQYTWAKVASSFGMFLVPWVALVAAAVSLVATIGIPRGFIPMLLVLAGLTLIGFSVIVGSAIVGESEGWYQVAVVVCNSSYGIGWYLIARIPQVSHDMGGPVAVWSPLMLALLAGELAGIVLVLGLTFFLQSRKRDFI
jgi:ABC-2 type transport system permease protein